MNWNYQTEYNKLLAKLLDHTADWINVETQAPPTDGTPIYFMCGIDYKAETLYDVGYWLDYTNSHWYQLWIESGESPIAGEWDTEFGNCEVITAWKFVEYKE